MKFILLISLLLPVSTWGMEAEKEENLFPIGSLTLYIDDNTLSGEALDEINYLAGEFGAHYTGKYYNTQDKILKLQNKIDTNSLLQSGNENTRHYYASKLAYLKDKLAYYERLKEDFSSLPEILRKVLLLTLRNPNYVGSRVTTTASEEGTQAFLYFSLSCPMDFFFTNNDSFQLHLEKHYPLIFKQLELNSINCPKSDRIIWDRVMKHCRDFVDEQINIENTFNIDKPDLYGSLHFLSKDLKRFLPKHFLESLGTKEEFRTEIIERIKRKLKKKQYFSLQMIDLSNKINDLLKTFSKDVKEFYKILH